MFGHEPSLAKISFRASHQAMLAPSATRRFDIYMQYCPHRGGGELKITAAILERPVIEKTLKHLGLEPQPPPIARAREAVPHLAG